MTLLTWIRFAPAKLRHIQAPFDFCSGDVSVIVPVRGNQPGIDRFLDALFATNEARSFPREVIIVDNDSPTAITIPDRFESVGVPVRVIRCAKPGPASARNAGFAASAGRWLLFADSDCIPTESFLSGYSDAMNGSVAYAGYVRSYGADQLSRYYEAQEILVPPRADENQPQYLITANALVWREAFEAVGGFDENFVLAGGEDIDLGFRLSQIGSLSYAPGSIIRHAFDDGHSGFVRRFIRYGRGNHQLSRRYGIDLQPRFFRPTVPTPYNWLAALAQFSCLSWGYWSEELASS